MGSVSLAMGSFVRGIVSDKPLPAKFTLSLFYLALASLQINFYKRRLGTGFKYPWQRQTDGEFCMKQLMAVCVGGFSEFLSSVCTLMTLNAATNAHVN